MIVFAHPGHWAVQLIYLFPFAVLVAIIVAGRIRDRRAAAREGSAETEPPAPPPGVSQS